MAAEAVGEEVSKPSSSIEAEEASSSSSARDLLSSYLGISFAVFLGFLPHSSVSYVTSLQSRNRILSSKLLQAEDQLKQMRSGRREDSRANARVAEIFAGQRNTWHQEERRLVGRIEAAADEIDGLRDRIAELEEAEAELRGSKERLEREVSERDEMLDFMSRGAEFCEREEIREGFDRVRVSDGVDQGSEICFEEHNGFHCEFSPPAAASEPWKDIHYNFHEPMHQMKHFVGRRESPWKVNDVSTGMFSKLKLIEQELSNLEKVGKGDLSKVPTLMRKQAKRYQSLAEKIDDLCKRMQVSDPCEPALNPGFRNQRQTEYLLEAIQLRNRVSETRQKMAALQTEAGKSFIPGYEGPVKPSTRRALDSVRNNFREIQRNLEIWLARITGDLEGILARDGSHLAKDYCSNSPYPSFAP